MISSSWDCGNGIGEYTNVRVFEVDRSISVPNSDILYPSQAASNIEIKPCNELQTDFRNFTDSFFYEKHHQVCNIIIINIYFIPV